MNALSQQIHDYLAEEVLGGDAADLVETTPLFELGILDSMSMLKLVSWIESRFGLSLASEDLVPENFSTIQGLSLLLDRRLAERNPG